MELPQKKKISVKLYDPGIPILDITKGTENRVAKGYVHFVLTAILCIIARCGNNLNVLWWMKSKRCYVHAMEYFSSLHRKEIMPFGTTWINREDIILSEISQTETNTTWSHLNMESKKVELMKTESRMVANRGWGMGKNKSLVRRD